MPELINVVADSCIAGSGDQLIAVGKFAVLVTDHLDRPIPASTPGLQHLPVAAMVDIVDGSLASEIHFPNPTADTTSPLNLRARITITDSTPGEFAEFVFRRVLITADEDGNWDFATFDAGASTSIPPVIPGTFGPSGPNHRAGSVPDPGATAGETRFLCEDGGWSAPATGDGGGVDFTPVAPLVLVDGELSLPAATNSVSGHLTAADHAAFAAKQPALGFTPLNPANHLNEVDPSATRASLGLGTAATTDASAYDAAGAAATALGAALLKAANLSDLPDKAAARVALMLGSLALQAANAVAISGGAINGTPIGASSPSTGAFTALVGGSDSKGAYRFGGNYVPSSTSRTLFASSGLQTVEVLGTGSGKRSAFTFASLVGGTPTSLYEFGTDFSISGQQNFYVYNYVSNQAPIKCNSDDTVDFNHGIILTSPSGARFKLGVDNSGNLSTTAV